MTARILWPIERAKRMVRKPKTAVTWLAHGCGFETTSEIATDRVLKTEWVIARAMILLKVRGARRI